MNDPPAILQIKQLNKTIGRQAIVTDVSFWVDRGQVVGLFGPNGAGKTTTFYMVAGILSADSGQILFGQRDISQSSLCQRAAMGINYLAQESSVFSHLTVYDNIYAILEYRKDLDRPARRREAERLLSEFNIERIRDVLSIRLSGGERRRTEIARLLAANPQVVLMDEPFAGIDPITIKETKTIIARLRDRGVSVLITDHNIRESLEICDYIYIFNLGRIIARGDPDQIRRNSVVQQVYLGTESPSEASQSDL